MTFGSITVAVNGEQAKILKENAQSSESDAEDDTSYLSCQLTVRVRSISSEFGTTESIFEQNFEIWPSDSEELAVEEIMELLEKLKTDEET